MDTAERGTFLNRRKKFSEVASAISASLMPRAAANRAAVWTTLAGSVVRARSGPGGRESAAGSARNPAQGGAIARARRASEIFDGTPTVTDDRPPRSETRPAHA